MRDRLSRSLLYAEESSAARPHGRGAETAGSPVHAKRNTRSAAAEMPTRVVAVIGGVAERGPTAPRAPAAQRSRALSRNEIPRPRQRLPGPRNSASRFGAEPRRRRTASSPSSTDAPRSSTAPAVPADSVTTLAQ